MHNPNISSIYGSLIGILTSGTFNAFEKNAVAIYFIPFFSYTFIYLILAVLGLHCCEGFLFPWLILLQNMGSRVYGLQ